MDATDTKTLVVPSVYDVYDFPLSPGGHLHTCVGTDVIEMILTYCDPFILQFTREHELPHSTPSIGRLVDDFQHDCETKTWVVSCQSQIELLGEMTVLHSAQPEIDVERACSVQRRTKQWLNTIIRIANSSLEAIDCHDIKTRFVQAIREWVYPQHAKSNTGMGLLLSDKRPKGCDVVEIVRSLSNVTVVSRDLSKIDSPSHGNPRSQVDVTVQWDGMPKLVAYARTSANLGHELGVHGVNEDQVFYGRYEHHRFFYWQPELPLGHIPSYALLAKEQWVCVWLILLMSVVLIETVDKNGKTDRKSCIDGLYPFVTRCMTGTWPRGEKDTVDDPHIVASTRFVSHVHQSQTIN